ncbi:hypothetical protein [Enterovirga sp. CN4-39]|uniref:hypothetical protein n=1 Tax=Enterovirga sp. CN4-39 TaxID=3400910 RepID=UPI003C0BD5B8
MSSTADSTTTTNTIPEGPATLLRSPEDVLRSPDLTLAKKREVLARWASDAHAVENAPALRQLDDGAIVGVDEVLAALKALDGERETTAARMQVRRAFGRKRGSLLSRLRVRRRREDRDDDPPPRPAAAAYPVEIRVADALAA